MYRCCIYLGQNTQKKAHLFTDVLQSVEKVTIQGGFFA